MPATVWPTVSAPGQMSASVATTAGDAWTALRMVDHLELLNDNSKRSTSGSLPCSTATAVLAEISEDRARFLTAEAVLAPVTLVSGRTTRVRFRRACNSRRRDTFNWWSSTLKRLDPPSRARYLAALDRGQHTHRDALLHGSLLGAGPVALLARRHALQHGHTPVRMTGPSGHRQPLSASGPSRRGDRPPRPTVRKLGVDIGSPTPWKTCCAQGRPGHGGDPRADALRPLRRRSFGPSSPGSSTSSRPSSPRQPSFAATPGRTGWPSAPSPSSTGARSGATTPRSGSTRSSVAGPGWLGSSRTDPLSSYTTCVDLTPIPLPFVGAKADRPQLHIGQLRP